MLRLIGRGVLLLLSTFGFQLSTGFAQSTAFSYQGVLQQNGAPFTGSAEIQPTLWNALSDGSQVAAHSPASVIVGVTNGLFTATLDFSNAPFSGQPLWLQLDVRTTIGAFTTLTPRQSLSSAPYAIRALAAGSLSGILPVSQLPAGVVTNGGSGVTLTGTFSGNGGGLANVNAATLGGLNAAGFWKLGGNSGGNPTNGGFLGTADNQPLELRVNGTRALRLEPNTNGAPNMIGGAAVNVVANGAVAATISGGGATNYNGISATNSVGAHFGTIGGGGANLIGSDALSSTIAGGYANTIYDSAQNATISGGYLNVIQRLNFYSVITGGTQNTIQSNSSYGFIGGGSGNSIYGLWGTIGGGRLNTNQSSSAVIGGGFANSIIDSSQATVAGGWNNMISGNSQNATIGGGVGNTIAPVNNSTTIAGGAGNTIQSNCYASFIGAGNNNIIQSSAQYAMIGGGSQNSLGADRSTIGGGAANTIQTSAASSTIGGGAGNTIQTNAFAAAIAGGSGNVVSGSYGTVPGGSGNLAGRYSLAAGNNAKANNTGSFVWADSTAQDFASTSNNQFLIRAIGGVAINTNDPAGAALRVAGRMVGDSVGIGTLSPAVPLHVRGGDTTQLRLENAVNSSFWSIYSENNNNSGNLLFLSGTGAYGYVRRTDGAFLSSSDRQLKKDITSLSGVLDRVLQLRPVSYRFRSEPDGSPRTLGLIAQEVEPLFPEAVDEHAGLKALAYSTLVPVTIRAIQELNQRIESQQSELRERDAKISTLEQRLAALEELIGHSRKK